MGCGFWKINSLKDFTILKKIFLFIFVILALNFVLAESISEDLHLNIQTTFDNGTIQAGTFDFVFNISTTDTCDNIIYTNSTTLTTDTRDNFILSSSCHP